MALDLNEAVPLSAQHLSGITARIDDGVWVFFISDGESAVEISHEFGNPEEAARHFEQLGRAAIEHAEHIRVRARTGGWT